jgi:hypothetical protein
MPKMRPAAAKHRPAYKEIRIDASGKVDLSKCPVYKDDGDQVRWVSDFGPWKIEFSEKAFRKGTFHIRKGGGYSEWSGKAAGRKREEPYSYTVTGMRRKADPDIIIK